MTFISGQGRFRPRSMFAAGASVVFAMLAAQLAVALWLRDVSVTGVADEVDAVMTSSAESAEAWVEDFVGATESSAEGIADWVGRSDPSRDDVVATLLAVAEIDDQLSTLVIAYPDGGWIGVRVPPEDEDYAASIAESVPTDDGYTQTAWLYDEDQTLVQTRILIDGTLPHELSFWSEASTSEGLVWTVSEVTVDDAESGVWAAVPVHDEEGTLLAVVAAEFPVSALADVLGTVSLGDGGGVALLDSERRVIALAQNLGEELPDPLEGSDRPTAEDIGLATEAAAEPSDSEVVLASDGSMYVAEVGLAGIGVPWVLHLRAFEEEIAPEALAIRKAIRIASFIQLGVLAVGAALFFSFWKPLRQVRAAAFTDALTGLLRRGRFMQLAPGALASAHREGRAAAVVVMDLDNFKGVNDEGGHAAGDQALAEVASALVRSVHRDDLVCRWGGDEFVVLLSLNTPDTALIAAERLRGECERALVASFPGDESLGVTAGVQVARAGDDDVSVLVREADERLIAGKQHGKSRTYGPQDRP